MQDLQLTPIQTVALFETTKAQRQEFKESVMQNLKDGLINPLELHLQIKAMADLSKSILEDEDYHTLLMDEAGKYPGKKFEFKNCEIEKKEVGTTYDWSKCNDPKLSVLKGSYQEREKMLKALPLEGLFYTDTETGESYHIYPPAKASKTSISVKLK